MNIIKDIALFIYPYSLVIHLAAVISWMAGIFYLPRLYVYHTEKSNLEDQLHDVFQVMEFKLLQYIMRPAMILTWISGAVLVMTPGIISWAEFWPWIKALMVISMTIFHFQLARWRLEFVDRSKQRSGRFFRLANEIPTILMLVIVLMVVARPF